MEAREGEGAGGVCRVCVCVYVCVRINVYAYVCVCECACACIYIHTHMRVCDGVCGNETVFVFTVFVFCRRGPSTPQHTMCVCVTAYSNHPPTQGRDRDVYSV